MKAFHETQMVGRSSSAGAAAAAAAAAATAAVCALKKLFHYRRVN